MKPKGMQLLSKINNQIIKKEIEEGYDLFWFVRIYC